MHAADPEVSETIKRSKQPYFVAPGQHLRAAGGQGPRQRLPLHGGIVPDPAGIITAGHDNKTARTVAIGQGEAINAPDLSAMFRHIIANNRAGGWSKVKRER